jgi:hypothetical protein
MEKYICRFLNGLYEEKPGGKIGECIKEMAEFP